MAHHLLVVPKTTFEKRITTLLDGVLRFKLSLNDCLVHYKALQHIHSIDDVKQHYHGPLD